MNKKLRKGPAVGRQVSARKRPTKKDLITPWINPEERVTVDFTDQRGLNAIVTGCTSIIVDVALETRIPHDRQEVSIPLRLVRIGKDRGHYTRDPDEPLRRYRLRLIVNRKRPEY